ncbi:hypothetical protein [Sphingomonas sp. S2-65]|uniref:hypothetical protein n=1 Tax=Sphingomonas sp. S2-65 TaxID=2903960 RepID=UPI001F2FA00A|nr:hypothetical protein [Sphingomonas sp. S2-65]UYY57964.1 hypothetical protein LZ586_15065 [Sphingomonas sp. S2-65]
MIEKLCVAAALLAASSAAPAAEPAATPVPASVRALSGCWEGRGEVMGKAVAVAISAYPIVGDAMVAVEAASSAIADPEDQYAAHLILGGGGKQPNKAAEPIVGYWADSFGGAFAASARGESRADGFDMTYQYPDNAYVNRWRIAGDRLTWEIVARSKGGVQKPFAKYALRKGACR